ncbi:MAG: D-alanyl-D-alanine carboxypeptidase/D-alanyl-D-alanine-endopeptidase, partial [Gammaproteobacteria bacterium]
MRHITTTLIGILITILISTTTWAESIDAAQIEQEIENLIINTDADVNIGIQIVDLDNGQILYQRNPQRTFIPASTLKLLTSAAALIYFGPDYQFTTPLLANNKRIKNGKLSSDVYLQLSGDPSLNQDELRQLFSTLKTANDIDTIQGDFVIDTTIFNGDDPHGPGWMVEDTHHAYGAGLSPIILDKNHIRLTIQPNTGHNQPAIVHIVSPTNGSIQLNNEATTAPKKTACKIKVRMHMDNTVKVSGCIPKNRNKITRTIAIKDPLAYSKNIIAHLLQEQAIELTGEIKTGSVPEKAIQL